MKKSIALFSILTFVFTSFAVNISPVRAEVLSQIRITEVMANPLDEDTGEFVELINLGDSEIDLWRWMLGDPADNNDVFEDYTTLYDWGKAGTVLEPGARAIIVDPEYAGEYNDFLTANADPATTIMIKVYADTSIGNGLGNSGDTLTLTDFTGNIIDVFDWSGDAGEGISWEKNSPELTNEPMNWSQSANAFGSSPGIDNNDAPQITAIITPDEGEAPLTATYNAAISTDPENDSFTAAWNFGDGGVSTEMSGEYIYDTPGEYTVSITLTDSHGAQSENSEVATVVVTDDPIDPVDPTDPVDPDPTDEVLTIAEARTLDPDAEALVEAIVTVKPGVLSEKYFYVEDSTGGMQIYVGTLSVSDFSLGDKLKIKGTLSSTQGETRLKISDLSDIEFLSSNLPITPTDIKTGDTDEDYEGKLVRVQGNITETSGSTFYLDDDTGAVKIYVDPDTEIDLPDKQKGDFFMITGVVSQTSSGYRILPRSNADISTETGGGIGDSLLQAGSTTLLFSILISLALTAAISYVGLRRREKREGSTE
ncbi:PKD domain-containing protein [Patescibacteria group bacterium]